MEQESEAFIAWISTFAPIRPVNLISDLGDGAALFDILSFIDPQYFGVAARPPELQSDNWVLRFSFLKRIYRLISQYYAEILRRPPNVNDVPDLQAISKDYDTAETLRLCRLTIAITVQSEKNKDVIERIQGLKESYQSALMRAINVVLPEPKKENSEGALQEAMTDDDYFYQIQSDRRRIHLEKEALSALYQSLLQEHRTMQSDFEDIKAEKVEKETALRELQVQIDDNQTNRADVYFKSEIDRLQTALQKSEDALGMTENDLQKQTGLNNELQRKVEDLQLKANEAIVLKDRLDEYRHAADKLQKTENVMEKYKKKLEESADLRRSVKALEEQNASLVDKNATLEEEYRKVSAFKPLMESYKGQISDLENKNANKQKDLESLKFELSQATTRLKISADERAKDAEALELFQERVRELELASTRILSNVPTRIGIARTTSEAVKNIIDGEPSTPLTDNIGDDVEENEDGLGGELHDAISGTTMTDLKLQVRKLKRELEAAKSNQTEASRVLVLENLLEDANRMKVRYEADYLTTLREKLALQSDLEEIRSGKSFGDGPEAAIALRQRLNETVEELDGIRKKYADIEVQNARISRDLTITKSDLNLVNKDQLEILASLRESVNEDKIGLEAEVDRLGEQLREMRDKNKMQLEQINGLLMEKVSLQGESIGQRERMLEREKAMGDLRSVISGKDLPEDVKSRMLSMHEDIVQLKEQNKTALDKLLKARQFIKSQDKLLQDASQAKVEAANSASLAEAEVAYQAKIKKLEDEREQVNLKVQRILEIYKREQQLMLSNVHELGMNRTREHLNNPRQRSNPTSWLGQQRKQLNQNLHR